MYDCLYRVERKGYIMCRCERRAALALFLGSVQKKEKGERRLRYRCASLLIL